MLNEKKTLNGSILLADGMNIGTIGGETTYQELSGTIGVLLSEMNLHRCDYFRIDPSGRLNPLTDAQISDMLENPRSTRKNGDGRETVNASEDTAETKETKFENPYLESSVTPESSHSNLYATNKNDELSSESDGTIEICDDDDVEMDIEPDTTRFSLESDFAIEEDVEIITEHDSTRKSLAVTFEKNTNSLNNDTKNSYLSGTKLKSNHGKFLKFLPLTEKNYHGTYFNEIFCCVSLKM